MTDDIWIDRDYFKRQSSTMEVADLIAEGLQTDGAHYKQWYLEEIARTLGIYIPEEWYEPGIAP